MPPCPLWLLSCILGLGVLFAAYGQDSLPADADGLLEYAQKHRNHKHWRQADRAFKRFLEKFPKDRRQEEVLAQLARIQYRFARHYAAARGWYERLVKEFPQSKHHLQYRIAIARCYAAQNLRLRAIEEYEAIIKEAKDKKAKASLIRQVWGLKNKHLNFYVNQTFGAGKNPKVRVYSRQVPDAEMRLYRIPYAEILERLGPEAPSLGQAIAKVPDKARKLVKKWTEKFPATKKRWHNSQLEIPVSESGVYLLEADHDRLTMRLHVLINRYGLITKAAAGDLLLFAQNRKTGEPVKGMRIRAYAEKKTFEGVTDADGIFTASDFPLRTPLVGVFDDELVSVQPGARHWWGSYEKASLFYVSTDRPIYRPNHKVHFKIVHRIEEGSAFSL
ncbi:MAG: tetratricopeptide repeat protein [Planctomycetota bacterium]|nr:tetratricopeptide repeat protein [Planctomycetota bacterium]